MALLRPGRCGSRRQGGCLRHRTEAQRQPKGQHAGGTPALPGKAVPAGRVAACGIALKLSGSQTAACGRDARAPGQCSRHRVAACGRQMDLHKGRSSAAAKGTASRERGRPARSQARLFPTGRRQGGCPRRMQHCTEAQRQPKGQHAGGTPALPGKAVPAAAFTGWLPAASHRSSAAAKGTACGRDARAPGQGKNREYGLHLSSMH